MTDHEAIQAGRILADRTDSIETAAIDTGGVAITAHWLGGGQKLYYSLDAVRDDDRDYRERTAFGRAVAESQLD